MAAKKKKYTRTKKWNLLRLKLNKFKKLRNLNLLKDQRDNDPEYVTFRIKVLKRDGYRCQFPGCSKHSHLEIHHIKRYADHPLLRVDTSNGISLCKSHHRGVTGRESQYEMLFYNIVRYNQKEYEFRRKKT